MNEPAPVSQNDLKNSVLDNISSGIRIEVGDDALSARRSFKAFCEFVMEDEKGERWKQPDLHQRWDEILTKHLMVEILAPIEHAKTTQITVARPLYKIGKDVNRRFKIVSSSDEMAKEKLGVVKQYITNHPRYRAVFPWVRPDPTQRWESNVIFVGRTMYSKDPTIEARGVLSSTEGGRCDDLIGDDVCDHKNTIAEPASRVKVISAWEGVWLNRLADGGCCAYVGTPWHNLDLTAHLEKNPVFVTFKFAVGANYEPQWEAKWSKERLEQRCRAIGTRIFNQKFRLVSLSDEDKLFTPQIIAKIKRPDLALSDVKVGLPKYGGMDLGHRTGGRSPRSFIFTIAKDEEDRRIVCDVRFGKWKSTDQARQLVMAYNHLKHQLINVENNAYQDMLLDWIREMPSTPKSIPLKGFTTGKNKADETAGLPGMATEMENGAWIVPLKGHDPACVCGVCQWLVELENYPIGLFDSVMASWLAREAVRTGGGLKLSKTIQTAPDNKSGQLDDDWYNTRGRSRKSVI